MKKIKNVLLVLLLLASLALTACSSYKSSYVATLMIKSSVKGEISLEFESLDGTVVFKSRRTAEGEGDISLDALISEGTIKVYYDSLGEKEELGSISGNKRLIAEGGYVEHGRTTYIIIEADECKGGTLKLSLNG